MRKIIYPDPTGETKKLMIYEALDGIYLFGYDCLQDSSSIWDNWFLTLNEVHEYCSEIYNINNEDWVIISEPVENCQHDYILPTKVIGKETGKPKWGEFQTLIDDQWVATNQSKCLSFAGLTGNERLYVSGLISEFENAKVTDKTNAIKILKALKFDESSIEQIV